MNGYKLDAHSNNRPQQEKSENKDQESTDPPSQLTALMAALNFFLALYFLSSDRLFPKSCVARTLASCNIHRCCKAWSAVILFDGWTVSRDEIKSFAENMEVALFASHQWVLQKSTLPQRTCSATAATSFPTKSLNSIGTGRWNTLKLNSIQR